MGSRHGVCSCAFIGAVVAVVLVAWSPLSRAFVIDDFNGTGFSYTFDDFVETTSPASVNLRDTTNGWGGGAVVYPNPVDLTGFVSQYLEVDFTVEPGHGTDQFTIELYDNANRSVKYNVPTPLSGAGTPRTHTAANPFGQPTEGVGDFANFDFGNVTSYGFIGQFGSGQPFDVSFDELRFTPDAPPAYGGQAADAPWRAEAQSRIDQVRKADLDLSLTRPGGVGIAGATVRVIQQEHAFKFGSAVVGNKLAGNPNAGDQVYRDKVLELFNTVTLENTLKWPALEGEFGPNFSESIALDALDWASQNGLDVRGHTIVWPGFNNLPQSIVNLQNDPAALRQAVLDHVTDIATKTQGKLIDWDVVNEPRVNDDLLNLFGEAVMDEWFAAADAVNDARLFLNEYNIITGGEGNQSSRNTYLNQILGLQGRGAPIDAIGMQGHFTPGSLTGMEKVWEVLDDFHDATGLPIAITEFDFATTDEPLQAEYLRDFMTAVFAHDAVDEFIMWGFWAGAHWRPDAALFNLDWSIKPNGQAYLDLVYDEWWTDETLTTDAGGNATVRVFQGEHLVEVEVDGEVTTYLVTVGPDGYTLAEVFASQLVGDFNANGQVEQGDLDLVLQNWGQDGTTAPNGWLQDLPQDVIDQEELDRVLQNWGAVAAPVEASAVPEPQVLALVGWLLVSLDTRRRRLCVL